MLTAAAAAAAAAASPDSPVAVFRAPTPQNRARPRMKKCAPAAGAAHLLPSVPAPTNAPPMSRVFNGSCDAAAAWGWPTRSMWLIPRPDEGRAKRREPVESGQGNSPGASSASCASSKPSHLQALRTGIGSPTTKSWGPSRFPAPCARAATRTRTRPALVPIQGARTPRRPAHHRLCPCRQGRADGFPPPPHHRPCWRRGSARRGQATASAREEGTVRAAKTGGGSASQGIRPRDGAEPSRGREDPAPPAPALQASGRR